MYAIYIILNCFSTAKCAACNLKRLQNRQLLAIDHVPLAWTQYYYLFEESTGRKIVISNSSSVIDEFDRWQASLSAATLCRKLWHLEVVIPGDFGLVPDHWVNDCKNEVMLFPLVINIFFFCWLYSYCFFFLCKNIFLFLLSWIQDVGLQRVNTGWLQNLCLWYSK